MKTDKDNHSLIKRSRFECPKCDKSFLYRIGYFKHMQQHEDNKTELEPILVDTLNTKNETKSEKNKNVVAKSLKARVWETDDVINNDLSMKSCGFCGKSCVSSSNLKIHEIIHTAH